MKANYKILIDSFFVLLRTQDHVEFMLKNSFANLSH